MCKEGWCIGLGQEGVAWDGNCLKYLKSGWSRKKAKENKDLKNGGQGVDALKRGGFHTEDSYINQLLSITYEIYHSFDEGFEIRAKFLDISKSFDKVWHKGLIYKLRLYGFFDDLLSLLIDFFD